MIEKGVKAIKVSTNTWSIASLQRSGMSYSVQLRKDSCDCHLKCTSCDACIHMYTCTCTDHVVHYTVCKHAHFIHLQTQEKVENELISNVSDLMESHDKETEGQDCHDEIIENSDERSDRQESEGICSNDATVILCSDETAVTDNAKIDLSYYTRLLQSDGEESVYGSSLASVKQKFEDKISELQLLENNCTNPDIIGNVCSHVKSAISV